ncbi:uncharacterized protein B0H18DRAFT_962980 [Fomitopsis serialis]|uniref:uncharacterized protein n=1 Tax=Fomitopsis serialis TaxID=139415 RepID=UPI002008AD5F|nr:uncharacterized protein B0H18DRAFT_962980 [Neoantrodia serialis]KAH9910673.1 hypothetical protein B0H18DRAFT_962980 [Neoantrodia serialis]
MRNRNALAPPTPQEQDSDPAAERAGREYYGLSQWKPTSSGCNEQPVNGCQWESEASSQAEPRLNSHNSAKGKGDRGSQTYQQKPNIIGDRFRSLGYTEKYSTRKHVPVTKANAAEQEVESDLIDTEQSAATKDEYEYPEVVRKAFGDRYLDLPHVTGEVKVTGFTAQDWKNLQGWIEAHDDLNKFEFEYDQEKQELTTMTASYLHDLLGTMQRRHINMRWYTFFTSPEWVQLALNISNDPADYASIRGKGGSKKIADLVEAIAVGRDLLITSLNETAQSQSLYNEYNTDGKLSKVNIPKLLEMAERLVGEDVDDAELVALTCFNIEELIPNGTDKTKWSAPPRKSYTASALAFQAAMYDALSASNAGLIRGAGPLVAEHSAVFFGAARVFWIYIPISALNTLRKAVKERWSMEKWIASGFAIPVLESYDDNQQTQVKHFLGNVQEGYKQMLRMLAEVLMTNPPHQNILGKALAQVQDDKQRSAQYEQLTKYCEHLLHPPDEALNFDDHIPDIIAAVKEGALGTAMDRLYVNSGATQKERRSRPRKTPEELLAGLRYIADTGGVKRKPSEEDVQANKRPRDGPSTAEHGFPEACERRAGGDVQRDAHDDRYHVRANAVPTDARRADKRTGGRAATHTHRIAGIGVSKRTGGRRAGGGYRPTTEQRAMSGRTDNEPAERLGERKSGRENGRAGERKRERAGERKGERVHEWVGGQQGKQMSMRIWPSETVRPAPAGGVRVNVADVVVASTLPAVWPECMLAGSASSPTLRPALPSLNTVPNDPPGLFSRYVATLRPECMPAPHPLLNVAAGLFSLDVATLQPDYTPAAPPLLNDPPGLFHPTLQCSGRRVCRPVIPRSQRCGRSRQNSKWPGSPHCKQSGRSTDIALQTSRPASGPTTTNGPAGLFAGRKDNVSGQGYSQNSAKAARHFAGRAFASPTWQALSRAEKLTIFSGRRFEYCLGPKSWAFSRAEDLAEAR